MWRLEAAAAHNFSPALDKSKFFKILKKGNEVVFGLMTEKSEESRGKKSIKFPVPYKGKSRMVIEKFPHKEKVDKKSRNSL